MDNRQEREDEAHFPAHYWSRNRIASCKAVPEPFFGGLGLLYIHGIRSNQFRLVGGRSNTHEGQ